MILRALFFLGLVALFVPHEPNLGLGRPGADAAMVSGLGDQVGSLIAAASGAPAKACQAHAAACAQALGVGDDLQSYALAQLAQVRADIAAAQAARARGRH